MIGGRRPLRGRKPADRRVRVERPHSPYFRYTGPGQLVARPAASIALTPTGRLLNRIRAAVFGFTLSQAGMVRHWLRVREPGWTWRLIVNAAGGILTAVVLGVVVYEKFADGAYLVVILVPFLVAMMLFINRQYSRSARELAVHPDLVMRAPTGKSGWSSRSRA